MGVTGLWQIVQPCARPIKIETLNRKRLAVDASIWIYQFLKAVRDKEGNALRNSHVVGFFRRICKLLFFGIKPVFVFDGGAPVLKRQTIMGRKRRREGRREDAARTAGKLLAVQMQRLAEEEEQKRKEEQSRGRRHQEEESVPDEALVYVDEMGMSAQERQKTRKFRKTDAYHLPELDSSMHEMGGPNDMRVMSLEELEAYARQFDTGEDINVYDFSKIDYDSPFFMSLPAADRYNILNAARLRSRLRMGHSKEQLDSMFPDRMAFSKFQIERVAERNELTQRLMNINDPNGDFEFGVNGTGRVAGEKGREYVLVKNDGVEGGWALGVVTNEGAEDKPIDVDKPDPVVQPQEDESDADEDFEDVPIEGLNRLPKQKPSQTPNDAASRQRKALYNSRQRAARKPRRAPQDANSLFVAEESGDEEQEEWEDVDPNGELFGESNDQASEDEELRRAIAMSLEQEGDAAKSDEDVDHASDDEARNEMLDAFQQSAVAEARPIPKGSARAIANLLNQRSLKNAPDSRVKSSFGVPIPRKDDSEDDDDAMDLQAALAESRREKRKVDSAPRKQSEPKNNPPEQWKEMAKKAGFSGPLPFEKLDLGSSLLGKKKMQERTEEAAGGFENPELAAKNQKKAEPLPPWFSGDLEQDLRRQKDLEVEDRERMKDFSKQFQFSSRDGPLLGRGKPDEVIDLDAEPASKGFKRGEIVDLDSGDDDKPVEVEPTRMDEVAESVRAEPPVPASDAEVNVPQPQATKAGPFQADDSEEESDVLMKEPEPLKGPLPVEKPSVQPENPKQTMESKVDNESEDEKIEWSESEDEHAVPAPAKQPSPIAVPEKTQATPKEASRSPSMEFEDVPPQQVEQTERATKPQEPEAMNFDELEGIPLQAESPPPAAEAGSSAEGNMENSATGVGQQTGFEDDNEFDDFSDPEEEELLKALMLEAEEHARFASSLNNKTQAQNIEDYEKELKQLRNQQKKDRRDADEVTSVMITECQQLLRLFGLPYITAPMEAEAQCAELVRLGQVDGIVTDDSDCFLFGGTRIYKNMFNQAKFVECYLTSDIEKEFDLTREKLIQVAHLLGSDYTEGLPGVGPVTAIEILSEFQTLQDFKDWWTAVQMQQISKEDDKKNPFRKKFRRNATKLFLPPVFPDLRVDQAYLEPEVDSDPEGFQWGVPDLDALRSFLMSTIGWSQERTDEVLVPVIRDMNRRMDEGTQSNITAFFDGGVGVGAAGLVPSAGQNEGFAPRKRVAGSKRMGTALGKMAERAKRSRGEAAAGSEDDATPDAGASTEQTEGEAPQAAAKKPTKKRKAQAKTVASSDDDESEFEAPSKKKATRTRRK